MKPGPELDILIAEKVMGLNVESFMDHPGFDVSLPKIYMGPAFSTDIASAWLVVEKLHEDSWSVHLDTSEFIAPGLGGCWATIKCKAHARGRFTSDSDTVPHAICLVALKAVGSNEQD